MLSEVPEQDRLLSYKEKVVLPSNTPSLFAKKSYDNAFLKADEQPLEEYKPLIKFNKTEEEKKREINETVQSTKEAERMNIIKKSQDNIGEVENEVEKIEIENYQGEFGGATTGEMVVLAEIETDELNKENDEIEAEKKQIQQEEKKNTLHSCKM